MNQTKCKMQCWLLIPVFILLFAYSGEAQDNG